MPCPCPAFSGLARIRAAALVLLFLGAASGRPALAQTSAYDSVSVTLTPTSTSVAAGGTLTFSATVAGATSQSVAWFVDGVWQGNATAGTITDRAATVTYQAPAAAGTHVVKVVSNYNNTKSASATVTVKGPVAVTLTPSTVSTNTGSSVSLTAAVTGSTTTSVTWTVDGSATPAASSGTLAGTGLTVIYTAPAGAGTHTVTATSTADVTRSATATITALAPAVVVAVSPASATVTTGGAVALAAMVSGTASTAVTWSVDGVTTGNATTGTVSGTSSSITYKAPALAGTHTVKATSVADSTKSASAAITVKSPSTVAVALTHTGPESISVTGSVLLTATVTGTTTTAVTWSVDGVAGGSATVGTLKGSSSRIIYTAPATLGTHVIKATSTADATRSASWTVAVTASSIQAANTALVANVKNAPYNAKGNGTTDDTAAIQAAIDAVAGTGGTVQIPAGTYMIELATTNGRQGLTLGSNLTLSLDAAAILKAKPSSLDTSYLLYLNNVNNVNIRGGTLLGDRDTHVGTSGEWGMGIGIDGTCAHIAVEETSILKFWGDGIYVSGTPTDITLAKVVADGNRRQGLTIVAVDGMIVRDSTFQNTAGASPQNGIDIEPNAGSTATGIKIFHCTLANNTGGGLQSGPAVVNATTALFTKSIFMGNTVKGNSTYGISVSASDGNTVADNIVSATKGYGIIARTGATNTLMIGNTVTGSTLDGIWLNLCAGTLVTANTSTGNTLRGINNKSASGATLSGNLVSSNGIAP